MKNLLVPVLRMLLALPTLGMAEETPAKWSGTISVASYLFGSWDESKDVVMNWVEEYIRENYGLDVNFDIVYIEQANYREIINTRIAGGTAPDIFMGGDRTVLEKYYEQGAIASWDVEFFKENAPHTYEYLNNGGYQGRVADAVEMYWDYACMDDGKMVTIPAMDEQGTMPSKTLMYRKDWLAALGVSEDNLPTTLDAFVELMYRFANEDPDGNGVKDTCSCSESVINAIFGSYGTSCNSRLWLEDAEGNLVCTDVHENNKTALELCAKMYTDGVVGASCHASIDHYRRPEVCNDNGDPVYVEWAAINPEADFTYAPWPAGPDGEYGLNIGCTVSYSTNHVYNAALNDDPEKLAAIFQVMDIFTIDDALTEKSQYGDESVHYTKNDNGSVNALVETAAGKEIGIRALVGLSGAGKALSEHGMYIDFYSNSMIRNRLDFFANPQCDSYRQNKLTVTVPAQSKYGAELATLRDETFTSIITGVASIDSYDDYVQEWMEMGGDLFTEEEANEWYVASK